MPRHEAVAYPRGRAEPRLRFWARHHSSQTTISVDEGVAEASPYMVSVLKRVSPDGGRGTNGGRCHQPSGAKRANSTMAVGHSRGRVARARPDRNTTLDASMTPTAAA